MVQIVGKYEHVSNSPDFEDFLKKHDAPEQIIRALVDTKPIVTISEAGGSWTIHVSNNGKSSSSTFKLGEPYVETLPHGLVLKNVTSREGDKFIINSTYGEDKKGVRVYEFTEAGMNMQLGDDEAGKVSRAYKRI